MQTWQFQNVLMLSEFTGITHQPGDYLLFDVSPGYNDPGNTDTNWMLELKCFTTEDPFDCYFAPNSCQTVYTGTPVTAIWNTGDCRYEFTVSTGEGPEDIYNTDLFRYFGAQIYGNGFDAEQYIYLYQDTGAHATYAIWPFNNAILLNGVLTMSKSGETLTYEFTDETDYLHYKSGYTAATTNEHWVDWVSSGTSIDHYKWLVDFNKISMTSGDTGNPYYMYISHDSIFDWNDSGKTLTIELAPEYNEMEVTSGCDTTYSDVGNWCDTLNYYWTGDSFTYTTIWGSYSPFANYYMYININADETGDINSYVQIDLDKHPNLCSFEPNWYNWFSGYWVFQKCYLKIEITDVNDPINNFKAYNGLDENGQIVDWVLFYEIPKVSVDVTEFFLGTGETTGNTATVTSTGPWTAATIYDECSHISNVTYSGNTGDSISFDVSANNNTTICSGEITIGCGSAEIQINICQDGTVDLCT